MFWKVQLFYPLTIFFTYVAIGFVYNYQFVLYFELIFLTIIWTTYREIYCSYKLLWYINELF